MSETVYTPIVACSSLSDLDAAPYHRRWLVVDEHGNLLGRTQHARLADVQVGIRFGFLVIRAPGMLRMDLPLDVIEDDDSVRRQALIGGHAIDVVDEGDLAAAWMSRFLGAPCRLVKVHPDAPAIKWPQD